MNIKIMLKLLNLLNIILLCIVSLMLFKCEFVFLAVTSLLLCFWRIAVLFVVEK
jgi:hypothetical protein